VLIMEDNAVPSHALTQRLISEAIERAKA